MYFVSFKTALGIREVMHCIERSNWLRLNKPTLSAGVVEPLKIARFDNIATKHNIPHKASGQEHHRLIDSVLLTARKTGQSETTI